MRVDTATLTELGIIPTGEHDWALRDLLDKTSCRDGLEALRGMLRTPLADVGEIYRRQTVLTRLRDLSHLVNRNELGGLVRDLGAYTTSNFVHFPRSILGGLRFSLRHRDITDFLEARLRALQVLLNRLEPLSSALSELQGDQLFVSILTAFRDVLTLPEVREMRLVMNDGTFSSIRLCTFDELLRAHRKLELLALQSALAKLDAFLSLSQTAVELGGRFPRIADRDGSAFCLKGLKHPLLPNGVGNDVELSLDERVMFVTGPNMAGKSTIVRAIALAVYFSHLGLPVVAEDARVPLTGTLISSMNARDNIARGTSLYLAEVRRVKAVVEAALSGSVVVAFLDEVFRGTNVKDAVDATELLVTGLARADRGLFVIASHLAEVAEKTECLSGVGTWQMQVTESPTGPRFSFRLTRGISHIRLGARLLFDEGVVSMLNAFHAYQAPS